MPDDSPMCQELRQMASTINGMKDSLTLLHELSKERSENVAALRSSFETHVEHEKKTAESIEFLVSALETGQGVAKFVKWAAPVAGFFGAVIGSIAFFWTWIRQHIHFIP